MRKITSIIVVAIILASCQTTGSVVEPASYGENGIATVQIGENEFLIELSSIPYHGMILAVNKTALVDEYWDRITVETSISQNSRVVESGIQLQKGDGRYYFELVDLKYKLGAPIECNITVTIGERRQQITTTLPLNHFYPWIDWIFKKYDIVGSGLQDHIEFPGGSFAYQLPKKDPGGRPLPLSHLGWDINVPTGRQIPIYAGTKGEISFVEREEEIPPYGKTVVVHNPYVGGSLLFMHVLPENGLERGQEVNPKEIIAYVYDTSATVGMRKHLHFSVFRSPYATYYGATFREPFAQNFVEPATWGFFTRETVPVSTHRTMLRAFKGRNPEVIPR